MSHIFTILGDPYFWGLCAVYWMVSNAIGALPMPDGTESHPKLYRWFFQTANGFAANLARAAAGKIPGTDQQSAKPSDPPRVLPS